MEFTNTKLITMIENTLNSNLIHFFEESIKIKTLIDYKYYIKNNERIIKLFIDKGNDLSIYSEKIDEGYLDVKNKSSEFLIKLSDLKK